MKSIRLSFGERWLETQSWGILDDMLSFLSRYNERSIWLGEEAERPVEFYTITLASRAGGDFAIGICSEGHGLVPNLLLSPKSQMLFLGFNSEVAGIGVPEHQVRRRIPCDSVFFQFVSLTDPEIILVLHEIGVIAVTQDGDEIWRYSKDIVVGWSIDRGSLRLEFMDTPPVDLVIATGSVQA